MDEVLRHLRAITGGRSTAGLGEWVPHRALAQRVGDLARKLRRARQAGYVRSGGRGRNRGHRLTGAGLVRAAAEPTGSVV